MSFVENGGATRPGTAGSDSTKKTRGQTDSDCANLDFVSEKQDPDDQPTTGYVGGEGESAIPEDRKVRRRKTG